MICTKNKNIRKNENIRALDFIWKKDAKIIINMSFYSILKFVNNFFIFILINFLASIKDDMPIVIILSILIIINLLRYLFESNMKIDRNLVRNYYNKKIAIKKIELAKSISSDKEVLGNIQLLNDYQQENGGPILFFINIFVNLANDSLTLLISMLYFIFVRKINFSTYTVSLLIIGFEILFLLINNKKNHHIEVEHSKLQKKLASNNRLGNFYYSLLTSEFAKMKSMKNNNSNNFLENKYKEFLSPMLDLMEKYKKDKQKVKIKSYLTIVISLILIYMVNVKFKQEINILDIFLISTSFLSLQGLISLKYDYKENKNRLRIFFDFLDLEDKSKSIEAKNMPDDVVMKLNNLSFSYKDRLILENINFTFNKNKIYSLVGENGEGKTTLVKLILNILPIKDDKMIEINSNLINKDIGFSMREDEIFSFRLLENIALNDTYNENDIYKLVEDLNIFKKSKNRIDFKIGSDYGESGIGLSGGQINKIIFARIIYSGRNIIILDEPTANMDIEAELKTYEILKRMAKNKCIIIISHRLLSVHMSDEVLVLKDKTIRNSGSHNDLYEKDQYYRDFYKASKNQLKNFNK